MRVVPNLYPALERQEVVVHTPEHLHSIAELDDAQLDLVAAAWRERARAAAAAGFPYVHALVNEGREAGSSLPHTHSQLVWLREPPPAVEAEQGPLPVANVVEEQDGLVAFCPHASRLPYETWIAPVEPERGAFESDLLAAALRLLAELVRRLGGGPLNAWLHDGPHWHVELLPRRSTLAGLELGAGIYVNAVAPEDAASELRR